MFIVWAVGNDPIRAFNLRRQIFRQSFEIASGQSLPTGFCHQHPTLVLDTSCHSKAYQHLGVFKIEFAQNIGSDANVVEYYAVTTKVDIDGSITSPDMYGGLSDGYPRQATKVITYPQAETVGLDWTTGLNGLAVAEDYWAMLGPGEPSQPNVAITAHITDLVSQNAYYVDSVTVENNAPEGVLVRNLSMVGEFSQQHPVLLPLDNNGYVGKGKKLVIPSSPLALTYHTNENLILSMTLQNAETFLPYRIKLRFGPQGLPINFCGPPGK